MTIDIEDRLRRDLAAAVAAPVAPAPDLEMLRGRARRQPPALLPAPCRGHRRLAIVSVAAAIVVVVGALGTRPWEGATTAGATAACQDNFAERGRPADAQGLRYLPAEVPAGFHSHGALATIERPCKPKATALILIDNPGGIVRRAITIWGPDAADTDFFSQAQRPDGMPTLSVIALRGTQGRLQWLGNDPRDLQVLGWTEPASRHHWVATSVGMRGADLASLVNDLSVQGDKVSIASPASLGFHQETPQPSAATGKQVQWYVDYQPDTGPRPDSDITITVRRGDLLAALSTRAAGIAVFDAGGHPSMAFKQGNVSFLEEQLADGVTVLLSGPTPADRLLRLAASLQSVDAADARITRSPK